jgi:hypothetical protein
MKSYFFAANRKNFPCLRHFLSQVIVMIHGRSDAACAATGKNGVFAFGGTPPL